MLESLACADNILYACRGGGGFIRTEWVCNTPPSSFLIKLPSYCFMWVTARTRVLLEPRYQSWWKKRANWVKWIIWTHVCCPSQPFRANICINNVLFAIHLEKVECASQFHSRVWRGQTQVILFFIQWVFLSVVWSSCCYLEHVHSPEKWPLTSPAIAALSF